MSISNSIDNSYNNSHKQNEQEENIPFMGNALPIKMPYKNM
jgi:hypothetical protein